MVVKTFRGLLADGGQDRIRLGTIKGKVGYKIINFQVVNRNVGATAAESCVKIWKKEQSTIDNIVNFTDSDLLAMAYYQDATSSAEVSSVDIIFDNEIFNQDIFVTSSGTVQTADMNYYIELEVIPLDDAGAEYTTLKDMRQ